LAANPAPYLNPVVEVVLAGRATGRLVASAEVTSDRRGKADACLLTVANAKGELGRSVKRGDPLRISWGYAEESLTEIFRGVMREVGAGDPLAIRGIDFNTVLNARRVTVTYEDETASGVIKALMAGMGLDLDIKACDVLIDRLPLFDRTLREGIDAVGDFVRRTSGEEFGDYIREGLFHWGMKNASQIAVHAFRTGSDIIRLQPTADGLTLLETLVVPVRHSEVVTIDGERSFVVKAEYIWQDGGRTKLWCEPC
jgi:hypothetical protein